MVLKTTDRADVRKWDSLNMVKALFEKRKDEVVGWWNFVTCMAMKLPTMNQQLSCSVERGKSYFWNLKMTDLTLREVAHSIFNLLWPWWLKWEEKKYSTGDTSGFCSHLWTAGEKAQSSQRQALAGPKLLNTCVGLSSKHEELKVILGLRVGESFR